MATPAFTWSGLTDPTKQTAFKDAWKTQATAADKQYADLTGAKTTAQKSFDDMTAAHKGVYANFASGKMTADAWNRYKTPYAAKSAAAKAAAATADKSLTDYYASTYAGKEKAIDDYFAGKITKDQLKADYGDIAAMIGDDPPPPPPPTAATINSNGTVSGGLIQNAQQPPATTAPPATAAQVTATPAPIQVDVNSLAASNPSAYRVNAATDTVQGQLSGLINSNNPILQKARQNAMESMAKNGLLHSTMAGQAADEAWYSAALPVAKADADTYSAANTRTTDAINTASQFNATQKNSALGTNVQYGVDIAKTNAANAQALQLKQFDNDLGMQQATIEANYKNLMQTNQSASQIYTQISSNMQAIMVNTAMDAKAKKSAISNQLQLLKSGMDIMGSVSNLNLGSILDFQPFDKATYPDQVLTTPQYQQYPTQP